MSKKKLLSVHTIGKTSAQANKQQATKKRNYLNKDDRILWEHVAKTARPLLNKNRLINVSEDDLIAWEHEVLSVEPVSENKSLFKMPKAKEKAPERTKTVAPKPAINQIFLLDRPTYRKISKGRLDIDARIDLHGLTQSEAYEVLYAFLANAHARGLRHVLIITGKGRSLGSDGILKQTVPHWFSTPLFRLLVSAYEDAAPHHGGHGAIYVRLRRRVNKG